MNEASNLEVSRVTSKLRELRLEPTQQPHAFFQPIKDEPQMQMEAIINAIAESDGEVLVKKTEYKCYQNDRNILLHACKKNGLVLQYVASALKFDAELVRVAVKCNGLALQFASLPLRQDRETALSAVEQNGAALAFVTTCEQENKASWDMLSLQDDPGFIFEATQNNPKLFSVLSTVQKNYLPTELLFDLMYKEEANQVADEARELEALKALANKPKSFNQTEQNEELFEETSCFANSMFP